MYKYELYCGLTIESCSEDLESSNFYLKKRIEIIEFIFDQAALLNLNITIIDTIGSWNNNQNELIIDEGVLITVLGDKRSKRFVKELGSIYKQKYNEESVLFTETELNYEFL